MKYPETTVENENPYEKDTDEYYLYLEGKLSVDYNYKKTDKSPQPTGNDPMFWKPVTSNDETKNSVNNPLIRTDRPNGSSAVERLKQAVGKKDNYKPPTDKEIEEALTLADQYIEANSNSDSGGVSDDLRDMINLGL